MTKYVFNVSFVKTIIANNEEDAIKILQEKLQHISECKRVELIEEMEKK